MPPFEHALVVGKFAPLHRGHQFLLDAAQAAAPRLTVLVWSNPDFSTMPNDVRAAWVEKLYPDATVIIGEDGPRNDAPDQVQHDYVGALLEARDLHPDVVLTRESYGPAFAAAIGASHQAVLPDRSVVPVSGTAIREDIHKQRHLLDPRVYRHFVERVVFLGAEGTGKSTLAERMAVELETEFVAEYGREHYEARDGALDLDDYVTIALRHREFEEQAVLRANHYLFVDTNAITTMFFSHYYNRGSRPALRELADDCSARYQHVIVCDDDIPFVQDGWRDNETWRARMQGMVLHDLAVRGIIYTTVHGTMDERVAQVAAALRREPPAAAPERRHSLGPKPEPRLAR